MATLLTVGHGTLTAAELAALLAGAGVEALVDVRRFPGSRRHPHFASESMARWLPEAGVAYRWEERLGGRRSLPEDSPDVALRNASFRGYAAHMRSAAFRAALAEVLEAAERSTTAVMCSESVWWRCHRRMIADTVTLVHEREVEHLMHDGRRSPHAVTDGARRGDGDVVYDLGVTPTLLDGGEEGPAAAG
jgi:uncharacterized protein (DUF488 family)